MDDERRNAAGRSTTRSGARPSTGCADASDGRAYIQRASPSANATASALEATGIDAGTRDAAAAAVGTAPRDAAADDGAAGDVAAAAAAAEHGTAASELWTRAGYAERSCRCAASHDAAGAARGHALWRPCCTPTGAAAVWSTALPGPRTRDGLPPARRRRPAQLPAASRQAARGAQPGAGRSCPRAQPHGHAHARHPATPGPGPQSRPRPWAGVLAGSSGGGCAAWC